MALRKIIEIDEEKCNGCGECVTACAEGAIEIRDGKAKLISETYCDGLGACLGDCPLDAITIVERDAADFDERAVAAHLAGNGETREPTPVHAGCPGTQMRRLAEKLAQSEGDADARDRPSQLANWPVQLQLVPPHAPFLREADIVLAADCVPFACADFHHKLLCGNPLLIACPKLDDASAYVEKLGQVFAQAAPRSVTIVHMEVPCCLGLVRIVQMAKALSGSDVPVKTVTVSIRGEILDEEVEVAA